MTEFVHGNLLNADVDAIVNAVNCVGVMGKGIALEFKKRFPENFIGTHEEHDELTTASRK